LIYLFFIIHGCGNNSTMKEDNADWCDENVKIACEIFAEEVRAKNRSGSHLNKLGYN
jgi:hypothetical protein